MNEPICTHFCFFPSTKDECVAYTNTLAKAVSQLQVNSQERYRGKWRNAGERDGKDNAARQITSLYMSET